MIATLPINLNKEIKEKPSIKLSNYKFDSEKSEKSQKTISVWCHIILQNSANELSKRHGVIFNVKNGGYLI